MCPTQMRSRSIDSVTFFIPLFEDALRKPSRTTDSSDTIEAILSKFDEYSNIESLEVKSVSKTQLTLESAHIDHPANVVYNVYIATPGEDGRTNVRLQIDKNATEAEREALKQALSTYADWLSDYDWNLDYKVHIALKKVWHRDALQSAPVRSYEDEIARELVNLTDTVHPRLVNQQAT